MNIPTPATLQAHQHAIANRMRLLADQAANVAAGPGHVSEMEVRHAVGRLQNALDDFADFLLGNSGDYVFAQLERTLVVRLDEHRSREFNSVSSPEHY